MIDKKELIEFFDHCAESWDEEMIRNDAVIAEILDNAGVKAGTKVLDVACGTGVLLPDYLARGVASVTGIDISSEMIKRAEAKFAQENVRFICADVETAKLPADFDSIVVYNAFPHFPNPEGLIERLSGLLAKGGRLTVAHGMSKKRIDEIHCHGAGSVSLELMSAEELAKLFEKYLSVTAIISDERMYQLVGEKS